MSTSLVITGNTRFDRMMHRDVSPIIVSGAAILHMIAYVKLSGDHKSFRRRA